MKYSIVIPCYNEEKNIPLILEKFSRVIQRDVEIILVDNGSTDGSSEVLKVLVPQYSFARTIKVDINQGYGFGILSGLDEAAGKYIGWTHADMQTDPSDVMKAISIAENSGKENLYVKGDRKGRPLFDQVFTSGMSLFESVYLVEKLDDINAQPNLFSRKFFESWQKPPQDFSLDLYALYMARKQKVEIIRFDVRFPPRIHGKSSWNDGFSSKWKFIKRTFDFSVQLKKDGIK